MGEGYDSHQAQNYFGALGYEELLMKLLSIAKSVMSSIGFCLIFNAHRVKSITL